MKKNWKERESENEKFRKLCAPSLPKIEMQLIVGILRAEFRRRIFHDPEKNDPTTSKKI